MPATRPGGSDRRRRARRGRGPSDYYREIYVGPRRARADPAHRVGGARAPRLEAMSGATAYVCGGAGSEDTMRANLEAFRRWRIVPRVLRDLADRELAVELLGNELPAPVLLAPIGVQTLLHPEGELATARAAAAVGPPADHQHRLRPHARGDRGGERRGTALVPALLAERRRDRPSIVREPRPRATPRSSSPRHLHTRMKEGRAGFQPGMNVLRVTTIAV